MNERITAGDRVFVVVDGERLEGDVLTVDRDDRTVYLLLDVDADTEAGADWWGLDEVQLV